MFVTFIKHKWAAEAFVSAQLKPHEIISGCVAVVDDALYTSLFPLVRWLDMLFQCFIDIYYDKK